MIVSQDVRLAQLIERLATDQKVGSSNLLAHAESTC